MMRESLARQLITFVCGVFLISVCHLNTHADNSASFDPPAGSDGYQQVAVEYRVWRITENKSPKGFTVAIVTLAPERFNKRDISLLADQLNKRFASVQRVQVGLLDDENAARLFVAGRLEYPAYAKAERGRYYLDRTRCKEYVQFYPQGSKAKQMIRLNCSRPEANATSTGVRPHEPFSWRIANDVVRPGLPGSQIKCGIKS